MNPIEKEIKSSLHPILENLYGSDAVKANLQIQETRKEFEGEFTLLVFPLTRYSKKSPEETGTELGEALKATCSIVHDFNVVKGFLNLSIVTSYWNSFLLELNKKKEFGFATEPSGQKMLVEYSSPNTNKPLHLGHLRNNFLGYSIAQILKANGHEVFKVQIINDRGIHICKSMLAWQKFGDGENPENAQLKGDHLVGKYYVRFDQEYKKEVKQLMAEGQSEEEAKKQSPLLLEAQTMLKKWEEGDSEVRSLWEKMNQWVYDGFEKTYATMGVDFDKLYYESNTYLLGKDEVMENLSLPDFYQKEDGSVWVNLEKEKMDPKLLLRGDGTSVYMTQDIGTAISRHEEYQADNYYYVVGNEQDYHFKVLSLVLGKMGYEWSAGLEHLSYGMVDLPSGKMKSREGTVVDADDLMQEMKSTAGEISRELGKIEGLTEEEQDRLFSQIGMGALKYFILKVDPKKRMLFDPQESVDFAGNTGPFIQYTYARIQSILRKFEGSNYETLVEESKIQALDLQVIQRIHQFPEVVAEAGKLKSPAIIANYCYELVKDFNQFYQNIPSIVKEEDPEIQRFRIGICKASGQVIKRACSLLGMQVPEKM